MCLLNLPTEVSLLIFDECFKNSTLHEGLKTYSKLITLNHQISTTVVSEYAKELKIRSSTYLRNIKVKLPVITINRFADSLAESPISIIYENIDLEGHCHLNGTGDGIWKHQKGRYIRIWENGVLMRDQVPFYPNSLLINYAGHKKGLMTSLNDTYFTFTMEKKKDNTKRVVLNGEFRVGNYQGSFLDNELHGECIERIPLKNKKIVKTYNRGKIVNVKVYFKERKIISWKLGHIKAENDTVLFDGYYDINNPDNIIDMNFYFNWTSLKIVRGKEELNISEKFINNFKNFVIPINDFSGLEESFRKLQQQICPPSF